MKKILSKTLPLLGVISLFGMTACACPKAVAPQPDLVAETKQVVQTETDEEKACKEIYEFMEKAADVAEKDAERQNVVLQIENTLDHCRLLQEPYENMGVLLLTSKITVDGKHVNDSGILVKFQDAGGRWVPVSISNYYSIDAEEESEQEENEGDGVEQDL